MAGPRSERRNKKLRNSQLRSQSPHLVYLLSIGEGETRPLGVTRPSDCEYAIFNISCSTRLFKEGRKESSCGYGNNARRTTSTVLVQLMCTVYALIPTGPAPAPVPYEADRARGSPRFKYRYSYSTRAWTWVIGSDSQGFQRPELTAFVGNKRMNLASKLLKQARSFDASNPWLSDHPRPYPSTYHAKYRQHPNYSFIHNSSIHSQVPYHTLHIYIYIYRYIYTRVQNSRHKS